MNPLTPLAQSSGLNLAAWRGIVESEVFETTVAACLLELQLTLPPTDAMQASQHSFRLDGARRLVRLMLDLGAKKPTPVRRDESALEPMMAGYGPPPPMQREQPKPSLTPLT